MSPHFWLDGLRMHVSSTADHGVVGSDTVLEFHQRGATVWAEYCGGEVTVGFLAGTLRGTKLEFRYTQVERSGEVHGGLSHGELERLPNGRIRIHEHFQWASRDESGTNIFDEIE